MSTNKKELVLTYQPNNYAEWLRSTADLAEERFKRAGLAIRTGKHPKPVAPVKSKGQEDTYQASYSHYLKQCETHEERSFEMYTFVWRRMSRESQLEVRMTPNYTELDESRDPVELMKAIKITHQVDSTSQDATMQKI